MSVVVTQGEAAALLQAAPRLGRLPVAALASTLEQKIVPIRSIREVAIALVSEGVDPFIPAVGLTSRIETQLEPGAPTQEFELIGAGIFRGDRLVGFAPLDLGAAWRGWWTGAVRRRDHRMAAGRGVVSPRGEAGRVPAGGSG